MAVSATLLTFITGRDAAMQLTHSGRSCISQHFFDGNDRVADEAVHELPALEQALACRDVMRRKTTAFILAWPDCVS